MAKNNSKSVLGLALFSTGFIVLLLMIAGTLGVFSPKAVLADEIGTQLELGNVDPTISDIFLTEVGAVGEDEAGPDPIVLDSAAEDQAVKCVITVSDDNGCDDIAGATTQASQVLMYRTDLTSSCTPNDQNCYRATGIVCTEITGSCTGGSDKTKKFKCTPGAMTGNNFKYYADATGSDSDYVSSSWTCAAIPCDLAGCGGTPNSDTVRIVPAAFMSVTESTIMYNSGSPLALGGNTGTSNQTLTINNLGNVTMDSGVSGKETQTSEYGMDCETPTEANYNDIPVGKQLYSLATFDAASEGTSLTGSDVRITSFDLANGAGAAKTLYWGINLSGVTGVGGTCNGTDVITVVNSNL